MREFVGVQGVEEARARSDRKSDRQRDDRRRSEAGGKFCESGSKTVRGRQAKLRGGQACERVLPPPVLKNMD